MISRRSLLGAFPAAVIASRSSGAKSIMSMRIRPAAPSDVPALVEFALSDARVRSAFEPELWSVAPDAAARIRASLATVVNPVVGPIRHHWIVADIGKSIAGVVHAANLPAPPIVDLKGGNAGIIFEDSCFPDDRKMSAALLAAVEHALRDAGAVLFIAASPVSRTSRTALFGASGYEPTTWYMARTGLRNASISSTIRPAAAADVGGIVRLSALYRARLQAANPLFWNIDAQADARFAMWMTGSLSLPDRSMFVSGSSDGLDGYVIAQPSTPLLLPAAHDRARVGLIDDFYAEAFETDSAEMLSDVPDALLAAAEGALAKRGATVALGICPVKLPHKAASFARRGYRTAFVWLVKDARI